MQELPPIETQKQLLEALQNGGVNLSRWGQGNAKTVLDLWHEIISGEVTLCTDPLVRRLQIVTVNIRRGTTQLVEVEQRFHDGRRRIRDLQPSEKIKPGETYRQAAIRCLQEELDVLPEHVLILGSSHKVKVTRKESYSYPMLESIYEQHIVDAFVPILPSADFLIPNNVPDGSDPVAAHLWGWRPIA